MDKAAVSRQVRHLIDLGLVERSPDPRDGRASVLAATSDARARVATVSQARTERLDSRLASWSRDDLSELVGLLTRYNETMDGTS
jgi:DNA-binding MarR family transcriptional regulator